MMLPPSPLPTLVASKNNRTMLNKEQLLHTATERKLACTVATVAAYKYLATSRRADVYKNQFGFLVYSRLADRFDCYRLVDYTPCVGSIDRSTHRNRRAAYNTDTHDHANGWLEIAAAVSAGSF